MFTTRPICNVAQAYVRKRYQDGYFLVVNNEEFTLDQALAWVWDRQLEMGDKSLPDMKFETSFNK